MGGDEMTKEEARKISSCFCNGVEFKEELGIPDEYQKLAEVMDEAINKQIPQKPIEDDLQDFRFMKVYICPKCGKKFSGTGVAAYCYHCGQALDWNLK